VSATGAGGRGAFERALRDRGAEQYDHWYRATKGVAFDRRERAVFRERVGRAGRALDLGAGTGRITNALDDVTLVVAIDFSLPSLRRLAHKELRHAAPVLADALALPLDDGVCDVVVSCQVLHHLDPVRLSDAMRECARVLAPGGRLIASVYNRDYWRNRDARIEIDAADHLYVRKFTATEFTELAAAVGFRPARSDTYKAVPDGGRVPERLSRWYSAFDVLACRALGRRGGCYLLYEGVRVR
jgi:SAM-dependent methyltransferase